MVFHTNQYREISLKCHGNIFFSQVSRCVNAEVLYVVENPHTLAGREERWGTVRYYCGCLVCTPKRGDHSGGSCECDQFTNLSLPRLAEGCRHQWCGRKSEGWWGRGCRLTCPPGRARCAGRAAQSRPPLSQTSVVTCLSPKKSRKLEFNWL